jgi:hypothetical protein
LGLPTTTILAGGDEVNDRLRSGFELSGGYMIDPVDGISVSADYFNAGRDSYGFVDGPNSGQILARPFFDAEAGQQSAQMIDVPLELAGRVDVTSFADFQGGGAALEAHLWQVGDPYTYCRDWISAVVGYRYYQHNSLVQIRDSLAVLPDTSTPLLPGTLIAGLDKFAASNEFNGIELGFKGRLQRDIWWLDGSALVAFGQNRRAAFVEGSTVTAVPGGGVSVSGDGLLVSSQTNFGRYKDTHDEAIPRLRLGGGVKLNDWVSCQIGYNVIIWDDVVQSASNAPPGLAVDPRNLPPFQAGGGPEPEFPGLRGTNLVAHGLDATIEIAY